MQILIVDQAFELKKLDHLERKDFLYFFYFIFNSFFLYKVIIEL